MSNANKEQEAIPSNDYPTSNDKHIMSLKFYLQDGGDMRNILLSITKENDEQVESISITNNSDKAFKIITNELTKYVVDLNSVFPRNSKDFYKSEKEKAEIKQKVIAAQNAFISKETSCKKYNIISARIEPPQLKTLLEKLVNSNNTTNLTQSDIDSQIDKIIDADWTLLDKDKSKIYNKDKLKAECTRSLGMHTIDGQSRQVFLTKDGIMTDGYAILSLNTSGIIEEKGSVTVVDPGSGPFGGYIRSFKMANKDKAIQNTLSDKTEYDNVVEQLLANGNYTSRLLGGTKTLSKKPTNKRKTKRKVSFHV
jgi:hypothetical protein